MYKMRVIAVCSFIVFVFSSSAIAQINISIEQCRYDTNDIKLSLIISNNSSTAKSIEIDSIQVIEQLSGATSGKQFQIAIRSTFLKGFVLMYLGDSLIDNQNFRSSCHNPNRSYQKITVVPELKVRREYEVVNIDEDMLTLLKQRKDIYIQFFLVYRVNYSVEYSMSKRVKVNYAY